MDFSSLLGIAIALAGIMGGMLLEGGNAGSMVQGAAFLIVCGGTVGAVLVQNSAQVFMRGIAMGKWLLLPPEFAPRRVIDDVVRWSQAARREGLLSLDRQLVLARGPLARKGLQLLIDGAEPDKIREVLEVEVFTFQERYRQGARVWEAAGGYSPTIGILGAVLGLIHVMENLSDPTKLGGGIAVAFVATIYGVGLANLVFLPVANKLKSVISSQALLQEILIDGLVAIANGEHPRIIENRLLGYMSEMQPGAMGA